MMQPLKLTAVARSLADAMGLAARGDFDTVPNCDVALTAMAAELKVLRKKITALYVGTAVGAFFILAQANSTGLSVDLFGVRIPVSMLSQQALAVFLGGAFAYYMAALASFALLYGVIAAILRRFTPEGWEYLLARYDADMLWTNMLLPKKLGYPSARGERRMARLVYTSNFAVVLSHVALVFGAIISAGSSAINSNSYFGILLTALALIAVLGAFGGAFSALFLPFEYHPPK